MGERFPPEAEAAFPELVCRPSRGPLPASASLQVQPTSSPTHGNTRDLPKCLGLLRPAQAEWGGHPAFKLAPRTQPLGVRALVKPLPPMWHQGVTNRMVSSDGMSLLRLVIQDIVALPCSLDHSFWKKPAHKL